LKVTPNGHENAGKCSLRDNSVKYILETCSTLMNYAQRYRHLSPYAENPFRTIEICRIPVQDPRPIDLLTRAQEQAFCEACDVWQFPLFLTLLLTGLRSGELTHLLLPDDLDLAAGWLRVRNKPALGWRVKTRNERDIPLHPVLTDVLRQVTGDRTGGPVFWQRRCHDGYLPPLGGQSGDAMEKEFLRRAAHFEIAGESDFGRKDKQRLARTVWRDAGALREDWVRTEFIRLTNAIGLPHVTAPKMLRHLFATILQDANVDPLIRNELMGHSPASTYGHTASLGMTGVYTHTRPETKRRQLEQALNDRPAISYAADWLAKLG
jgi:integrase